MTPIKTLIERLEKASGPDVWLDAQIFRAIGAPLPKEFMGKDIDLEWSDDEGCFTMPIGAMRVRFQQPPYSSSIDAALSLVPEGYGAVSMSIGEGDRESSARIGHPYVYGNGKTPAIALCIASLRARMKEGV